MEIGTVHNDTLEEAVHTKRVRGTEFIKRRKCVSSDTLLFERKDHVAVITLNRPAQRNAMNQEMGHALMDCLQQVREDGDIRAAIITGAGGTFSAGADLKERASGGGARQLDNAPAAVIEADPSARWKFALDVQEPNLMIQRKAMPAKWDWPLAAPLELQANAVEVAWDPNPNAPRLPLLPAAKRKPTERITLVPYGCTKFRISMFPVTLATRE